MTSLDQNELRTRELFDAYMKDNWTSKAAIVAMVFRAMWHASISAERVNKIGDALAFMEGCDLQDTLTTLVRAKVLRSFSKNGERRYEVNY